MSRKVGYLLSSTLAVVMLTSVGCQSTDANAVRSNPSPEMQTRHQTPDELMNNTANVFNQNWRSAWSDAERILLLHRPSRLNPTPNPW